MDSREFEDKMGELGDKFSQLTDILGTGMSAMTNHIKALNEMTDGESKANKKRDNSLTEEENQWKEAKARRNDQKKLETERLGYYKDELGVVRESIDLKKAEQRGQQEAVREIKKQVGEEAFLRKQQQNFLRDELDKIGASSSAYGGMVKSIFDLTQAQREQLSNAKKQKDADDKLSASAEKAAKALEKPGEAIKGYTTEHGRQLQSFSDVVGAGKDSLYDMAKGSKAATAGLVLLESVGQLLLGALMGAMKAALSMGKALLAGERGASVGAKGVTAFTSEMAKATKMVGGALVGLGSGIIGVSILLAPFTGGLSLAGVALGGLAVAAGVAAEASAKTAEIFAELNEIAAATNDKLFAGFKELGKMSLTSAQGMSGVADQLHKMGLTIAEFDKFKTVISNNVKEMKMFGATAAQGVNMFAETAGSLYKSEMGKALELMGISAEDQYEHTAKYLALQSRLGLLEERNANSLAKKTKDYIEELDKIAAITGASRKEQEDAMNAVMSIKQLRAGILAEEEKIKNGTGSKEKLEEMQRAIEVARSLQAQGATREATGLAQYYGAGKAVTSQESAEVRSMMGKTIDAINKNTGTAGSRTMLAGEEVVNRASKAAATGRYGADMQGYYGGDYNVAGDMKARQKSFDDQRAAKEKELGRKLSDDEQEKLRQEILTKAKEERTAKDPTTQQNVDMTRRQMETAITMEKAVLKYNEATGINYNASKMFDEAVKKFDQFFGSGSPTSGDTKGKAGEPKTAKEASDVQADAMAKSVKLNREVIPKLQDAVGEREREVDQLKEKLNKTKDANEKKQLEVDLKKAQSNRDKAQQDLEKAVEEQKTLNAEARKAQRQKVAMRGKEAGAPATPASGAGSDGGGTGSRSSADSRRTDAGSSGAASAPPGGPENEPPTAGGGKEPPKLARITSKSGKSTAVNSKFAPAFQGLIDELDQAGYEISSLGGYVDRDVRGQPGVKSIHSHGAAIDINPATNPMSSKLITDMPSNIADIAAKYGLGWGGNWQSKKDAMHFSAAQSEGGSLLKAKTGGVFDGPTSGYDVELHGREAIVPLPDPNSKLSIEKDIESVSKTSLSQVMNSTTTNNIDQTEMIGLLSEMVETMAEKLDSVIDKLSDGNDIQDKILKYSMS